MSSERGPASDAFVIAGPRDWIQIEVMSRRSEPDYWDGNWCSCLLTASIGGFRAKFHPTFRTTEFEEFLWGVEALDKTLKGQATFSTMERQAEVTLSIDRRGQINVSGNLVEDHAIGSQLSFRFSSDQTFLRSLAKQLKEIVALYPVRDREQKVAIQPV